MLADFSYTMLTNAKVIGISIAHINKGDAVGVGELSIDEAEDAEEVGD